MNTKTNKNRRVIRIKHIVKVTYFSTVFEKGKSHRYKFTAQLMIGLNSSMREIATKVIELSLGKMPNWLEKVHENQPISIYLSGRTSKEKLAMPYGIGYDLENNGNVKFLNEYEYEPLTHNWTYKRITELREAGYISGDINHIIVETPDGLGGPGDLDFITLINGLFAFIGILANMEGGLQFKDRLVSFANYRKMVKDFKNNGLHSLKQIRLLLETNKSWELKRIMRALSVKRNVAIAILKKLGYTSKNGIWSFDNTSTKALELRKQWLKQEKEEEKRISELIIESFSK